MINQKKFVAVTLALTKRAFIVYMAYFEYKMSIHLGCKAQMAFLLVEKVSIPKKHTNFSDIFFKKSAIVLFNCSDINKHAINLESDKQPLFKPIYSLD